MDLQWWRINCGWDDVANETAETRRFARYERAGCIGYCLSEETSFETLRLRQWRQCHTLHHFGRLYHQNDRHAVIGQYHTWSRCVWLQPDLDTAFQDFMHSLPPRVHLLQTASTIDPLALRMLRGQNYRIVRSLEDDDPGERRCDTLLSVQDFDRFDTMRAILALTR